MVSFAPKLPLEEIDLRRDVVSLWNEADVLASIEKLLIEDPDNECRESRLDKQNERWRETVEKDVKVKISELTIPELLKRRMVHIVRPIGLQIRDWCRFVETYLSDERKYLDARFLEQLCWTPGGAIDYKKTAENIVRLEIFDNVTRYRWACMFCLVDSIAILWEKLPPEHKKSFLGETDSIDMKIEFYWHAVLKREELKPDGVQLIVKKNEARLIPYDNLSFHQKALLRSALHGNKAASEYFFQKLTCGERDDFLLETACDVVENRSNPNKQSEPFKFLQRNLSDVLCYLLSVMSPEQQMKVFRKYPYEVFPCFLDWPWQDFLLDFAGILWTFLPETEYPWFAIFTDPNLKKESYPTPDLMRKFYLSCPSNFKKAFEWSFLPWFSEFSADEDYEFIEAVLKNMDPEGKASIGETDSFFHLIEVLVKMDKWRLLELWIREATPSEECRERVKEIVYTSVLDKFDAAERGRIRSRLNPFFGLPQETAEQLLST